MATLLTDTITTCHPMLLETMRRAIREIIFNEYFFLRTAVVDHGFRLKVNSFFDYLKYLACKKSLYTNLFDDLEGWNDLKLFEIENNEVT